MKTVLISAVLVIALLTGCTADAGVKFTKHFWDYRDKYVYANPALSDLQKEGAIMASGAVLKKDDSELEADLKAHKLPEEEKPGSTEGE